MTLATMKMTDQTHKAEHFRSLHVSGKPLLLFNIWDAGGAKAVTAAGAKAIATSSWSVANANGFSDGEQIPRSLVIENLRRIVAATHLPVTIDLESGYGDAPGVVAETIALAIEAGAVGCNLEDSFPRNGKLRETVNQCERVRSARRAAEGAGIRFFINARTVTYSSSDRPPNTATLCSKAPSKEPTRTQKRVRTESSSPVSSTPNWSRASRNRLRFPSTSWSGMTLRRCKC